VYQKQSYDHHLQRKPDHQANQKGSPGPIGKGYVSHHQTEQDPALGYSSQHLTNGEFAVLGGNALMAQLPEYVAEELARV